MNPPPYRSYRDLPPLAGLSTLTDAMRPGITVEDCVQRLKRYHDVLLRLHAILIAHIPTEPIIEL